VRLSNPESHKILGARKREWPKVFLPENRDSVTALDVLSAPALPERERAIGDWCRSVSATFAGNRPDYQRCYRSTGLLGAAFVLIKQRR